MDDLEVEFNKNQAKNSKYIKTKKMAEKNIIPIIRKIDPTAAVL